MREERARRREGGPGVPVELPTPPLGPGSIAILPIGARDVKLPAPARMLWRRFE